MAGGGGKHPQERGHFDTPAADAAAVNIPAECLDVRGGERKQLRGDNLRECGYVAGHARRDVDLYIMCGVKDSVWYKRDVYSCHVIGLAGDVQSLTGIHKDQE